MPNLKSLKGNIPIQELHIKFTIIIHHIEMDLSICYRAFKIEISFSNKIKDFILLHFHNRCEMFQIFSTVVCKFMHSF